jgi:hypothetical protein
MLRTIDPIASAISYIILIVINIGWILLVGVGVTKRLQNPNSRQFIVFISTGIFLIVIVSILRLLIAMDVIILEANANGINIVFVPYIISSLAIIYSYPAKTLKLLETKEEIDIDINDYFVDIFRLLFWPIGIWTIQPRINNIVIDKAEF